MDKKRKKHKMKRLKSLLTVLAILLGTLFPTQVKAADNNEQLKTDMSKIFNVIVRQGSHSGTQRFYHLSRDGRRPGMGQSDSANKKMDSDHSLYAVPTHIQTGTADSYMHFDNFLICMEANVNFFPMENENYKMNANWYKEDTKEVRKNLDPLFGLDEQKYQQAGHVIHYALKQGWNQNLVQHLFRLLCNQYKESKETIYPENAEDNLNRLKARLDESNYEHSDFMKQDQYMVTEGLLMAMRSAKAPAVTQFELDKPEDLAIEIPGYAVPGTHVVQADSVFSIPEDCSKAMPREDEQVIDGIYRPSIQFKKDAKPGIYRFTVERPNWNGKVTWHLYDRYALYTETQLPVDASESTQFLGRFDMEDSVIRDTFTVSYMMQEDPGKPADPVTEEDPDEPADPDPKEENPESNSEEEQVKGGQSPVNVIIQIHNESSSASKTGETKGSLNLENQNKGTLSSESDTKNAKQSEDPEEDKKGPAGPDPSEEEGSDKSSEKDKKDGEEEPSRLKAELKDKQDPEGEDRCKGGCKGHRKYIILTDSEIDDDLGWDEYDGKAAEDPGFEDPGADLPGPSQPFENLLWANSNSDEEDPVTSYSDDDDLSDDDDVAPRTGDPSTIYGVMAGFALTGFFVLRKKKRGEKEIGQNMV